MARRGTRKRLARGIYEDRTGRSGVIGFGRGRLREKRFPPFTPIAQIREWQEKERARLKGSGQSSTDRGTLAAAVDRWDRLERHLASWMERRAELRAWVQALGPTRFHGITPDDVRTTIGEWAQAGLKPKTIKNRLWSLQHLYRVLDGPQAETPVDHVTPPAVARSVPVHVPPSVVLTVYQTLLSHEQRGILRDAKTRARFMVLASTGRRPSEVMRTQQSDVDPGQRTWRVRDGKGGWSEGLFLNDDMLVAWMTFAQAHAWGPFHTGSFARALRFAGWPATIRPYNLRHSVGIALSESGTDLADVSAWLGHSRVQTTRAFYVPILQSRMQRSSERLSGRFGGWNVAPPLGTPDDSIH